MNTNLQLEKILDSTDFQTLQDEIANATRISMVAVDYRGKPVTEHSNFSPFCKSVRENPELCPFCEKCDARGGLEAAQRKKPYIYSCHMGVADFAIPIVFNGVYLGAIMGGQLLIKGADLDNHNISQLMPANPIWMSKYPDLMASFTSLETIPYKRLESLAKMVSYIVNYVIREAIHKEQHPPISIDKIDKESLSMSKAMRTLEPAINYINENYNKEICLDAMSAMCGISPTYFSKQFSRVHQQNLASYVNYIRISKAKILLVTTVKSIVSIAGEVGFQDCGYFIKTFKKIESVTPHTYREKSE